MKERNKKTNMKSKSRTPTKDIREGRVGVVGVGLRFPKSKPRLYQIPPASRQVPRSQNITTSFQERRDVKERKKKADMESKNRTPAEGIREGRVGVVDVGLGFPSGGEGLLGSDRRKSGPPELLGRRLLFADSEIESWQ